MHCGISFEADAAQVPPELAVARVVGARPGFEEGSGGELLQTDEEANAVHCAVLKGQQIMTFLHTAKLVGHRTVNFAFFFLCIFVKSLLPGRQS